MCAHLCNARAKRRAVANEHITAAPRNPRCTRRRATPTLTADTPTQTKTNMNRLIAALALGSAAAFAPAARAPASVVVFGGAGKYEGQIFGFPEKKDLWENWDPNSPRSETNFNPFERNPDGNACDCSGYFPGEGKYSDPARPDVDFAAMMAEKTAMAEIEANPKAGDVPGAPGRLA